MIRKLRPSAFYRSRKETYRKEFLQVRLLLVSTDVKDEIAMDVLHHGGEVAVMSL
jgi:hypothetical protein